MRMVLMLAVMVETGLAVKDLADFLSEDSVIVLVALRY